MLQQAALSQRHREITRSPNNYYKEHWKKMPFTHLQNPDWILNWKLCNQSQRAPCFCWETLGVQQGNKPDCRHVTAGLRCCLGDHHAWVKPGSGFLSCCFWLTLFPKLIWEELLPLFLLPGPCGKSNVEQEDLRTSMFYSSRVMSHLQSQCIH